MICKVGDDAHGDFILHGLQSEGVDTQCVAHVPGLTTGFVYVLVDPRTQTRTCIATPVQEELTPSDMRAVLARLSSSSPTTTSKTSSSSSLSENSRDVASEKAQTLASHEDDSDISLVHLDSRHTQAALVLAQWSRARGVPVSIDVEKDRPPHLLSLLPLCTLIFTNESFSRAYCPLLSRPRSGDAATSTTTHSTARRYKLIEHTNGSSSSSRTSSRSSSSCSDGAVGEWVSVDVRDGTSFEKQLAIIDSL